MRRQPELIKEAETRGSEAQNERETSRCPMRCSLDSFPMPLGGLSDTV